MVCFCCGSAVSTSSDRCPNCGAAREKTVAASVLTPPPTGLPADSATPFALGADATTFVSTRLNAVDPDATTFDSARLSAEDPDAATFLAPPAKTSEPDGPTLAPGPGPELVK